MNVEKISQEEKKAWGYLAKKQAGPAFFKSHPIWRKGFTALNVTSIHNPGWKQPVMTEDVQIPGWNLLPIFGKSEDKAFYRRLSRSIFNVNQYLRKWGERDYLPERCRWHDTFGHLPALFNEDFSNVLRRIGLIGCRLEEGSEEINFLGKLYWFMVEFSFLEGKPLGAGILSSPEELEFATSNEAKVANLSWANSAEDKLLLLTVGGEPVEDGFQKVYFNFESIREMHILLDAFIKQNL